MLHIREVSDIHLEFYYDLYDSGVGRAKEELSRLIPPLPTDKKTVLVVAGDLATARRANRIVTFMEILQPRFKHIIFVLGNHEHYNFVMEESLGTIIEACSTSPKINMNKLTIVGNEPMKVEIGGVTFLCGTLWTDYTVFPSDLVDLEEFKKEQYYKLNEHTIAGNISKAEYLKEFMINFEALTPVDAVRELIRRFITDHKTIMTPGSGGGVLPEVFAEIYKNTVAKFGEWMEGQNNSKTVVVTHHMPSYQAIDPQYQQEPTTRMLNHAFASDLDAFILKHQPALWFFGHTHTKYVGKIGETILHCNPLGYPKEPTVLNGTYDSTHVYSL